MTRIVAAGFLCFVLAQASSEIRIDTFDKKGNRTGYQIIDQRTGRVDTYDSKSQRTGFGYITTPPTSYGRYDQHGRSPLGTDNRKSRP